MYKVICADVLEWAENYEGPKFHAILTDPSYGLGDNPDIEALLTAWMSGEDYDTGPGFMQRDWDQLPSPRYWAALRRVCHSGAYLFAFGGTRTADLLSVAIRLGGWERFDSIDSLSWCYGSGFPKSTAIGKAIDRAANAEREVVGRYIHPQSGKPLSPENMRGSTNPNPMDWGKEDGDRYQVTAPATPLAAAWQGHGSATKPSHEPVLCFRNPLAKVPSDRIHAVTGWDWWHSEKQLKDTPQTRLKMLKKYGCRLPPLYGEADLVLITRKALHENVETDKLFVARARRQWRAAPTEPVTLARVDVKAYRRWSSKTYAANCLSTGAGGLWIDGSRVATGEDTSRNNGGCEVLSWGGTYGAGPNEAQRRKEIGLPTQGRWPPNVCLSHVPPRPDGNGGWLPGCERLGVKRVRASGYFPVERTPNQIYGGGKGTNIETGFDGTNPHADPDGLESVTAYACVLACDPSAGSGQGGCGHQWTAEQRGACPECGGESRWACAVGALGEQSGELKTRPAKAALSGEGSGDGHSPNNGWGMKSVAISGYVDKGTAARFYPQHDWQHEIAERLAGVVPFYYCAKSARRERDMGLKGNGDPDGAALKHQMKEKQCRVCGNRSIKAAPGKELTCNHNDWEWVERVGNAHKGGPARNSHPCVKPLSLGIFLARLIAPPPEYAPRRLLVPFSGSGSEICSAILSQNFEEIVGIEMEEEYVKISEARCHFWETMMKETGSSDPHAILKTYGKKGKAKQDSEGRSPDESPAQMSLGV